MLHRCDVRDGEGWRGGDWTDEARKRHENHGNRGSSAIPEMARFVGTKVEFGSDRDEFALNLNARALPLVHSDTYLNDLLVKYCEAALANRRDDTNQLRTKLRTQSRRCFLMEKCSHSVRVECAR